ncbi:MAG: hypothetical protein ACI4SQ_06280 [Eubacterium sp.]
MMPVDVIATGDTKVVLMDAARIMTTCDHGCAFHNQLICNLLKVVARKNQSWLLSQEKIGMENNHYGSQKGR